MAEILLLIGIGILFLLLLLTVVALLLYSGLFENIEIGSGKPPIGETIIAYKYARGPYRGAGYLFSEVARVGPSIKKSLGIYYDDAQMVDEYKCRYIVGAILAEGDEQVDEEIKKNFEEEGFKIFKLPAVTYSVKTTFPYRNTLSIFISIFRVYPKLSAYIKENRLCAHPFLEIYDERNIEFMAPLAKQDEFYVEEAKKHAEEPDNDYENDEDDSDDDEDDSFLDDSNIDEGSVPRSEITDGSLLENDDVNDGDDDNSDSDIEPDKIIFSDSRKDEVTDVTVTPTPPPAQNESTQPVTPTPPSQNESTLPGPSNLQDNVHSSEQVTPDQKKAEDEHETGSEGTAESGSSFEEIGVDKENIPSV